MEINFNFVRCLGIGLFVWGLILCGGCGDIVKDNSGSINSTEPISSVPAVPKKILKSSVSLLPYKTEKTDDKAYVIDYYTFTGIDLSRYNDFDFTYSTHTTCDEDVYVYNFSTQEWDTIVKVIFPPVGTSLPPCGQGYTAQYHIFSLSRLNNYKNYVDKDSIMQIKKSSGIVLFGTPSNTPYGIRLILYK